MMTRSAIGRFSSFCLFSLMVLALAGCSIISVDQKTRYRDAEGYFEPTLLTRIQPGETSLTWLTQHFGRPWYSEADGLEGYPEEVGVHTWRFAREQQKNTRVLLLFNSRKTDLQYEYLHVAAEGDIVKRAWKDELATVDIRRLMAAMGYRKVKNPSTELRDRPSTELRDRPSTELRDRPSTELRDRPSTELRDRPSTELRDRPSTELRDRPSTELRDRPSTELRDRPSTELRDRPSTELRDRPSTELRDRPSTELWDRPSTELRDRPSTELRDRPSTELRDRPSTKLGDRPSTELRERSATSSETELIAPPVADDIVDMEAEGALPEPALH